MDISDPLMFLELFLSFLSEFKVELGVVAYLTLTLVMNIAEHKNNKIKSIDNTENVDGGS